MTPDRVFMFPGKTKLEIVAGNSFVDRQWSRILCSGAKKITIVSRGLSHIPASVILEPRCRCEVYHRSEILNRTQILRHRSLHEMLNPIGNSQNPAIDEEFSDL